MEFEQQLSERIGRRTEKKSRHLAIPRVIKFKRGAAEIAELIASFADRTGRAERFDPQVRLRLPTSEKLLTFPVERP